MAKEQRIQVDIHVAPAAGVGADEAERGFVRRMGDEALWLLRLGIWCYHVAARWLTTTLIGQAVVLWLVTRVLYVLLTIAAFLFGSSGFATPSSQVTPHLLVQAWNQWDARYFYARLALHAYPHWYDVVFPPLYPLLTAAVTALTGHTHVVLAALIVSNLGTLGACVAVALLAQHELSDKRMSRQSVRVLLTYPLAFFLTAPYTEGLFITFAALALLSARRGWWYRAALCAWLATETRISGVALVLPLAVEYGRQSVWWRSSSWRRAWWHQVQGLAHPWRHVLRSVLPAVAVLGAVPLALVIQMLIGQVAAHDPLEFIHGERGWGHVLMWPWQSVGVIAGGLLHAPVGSYDQARGLLDVIPIVFCTGVTLLAAWRRWIPGSFVLYTAALIMSCILAPITGIHFDPAVSAGRYLLCALPITLLLAKWSAYRPWLDTLLVTGGFALQAVLLVYWLHGGWIV